MTKTVLLIEDDKIMRISLEDALKGAGYEVVSFETGSEALRAFNNTSCDVAVTDSGFLTWMVSTLLKK